MEITLKRTYELHGIISEISQKNTDFDIVCLMNRLLLKTHADTWNQGFAAMTEKYTVKDERGQSVKSIKPVGGNRTAINFNFGSQENMDKAKEFMDELDNRKVDIVFRQATAEEIKAVVEKKQLPIDTIYQLNPEICTDENIKKVQELFKPKEEPQSAPK